MTHSTRMQRVLAAAVLTALFATPTVQASLVGDSVTVTFKETDFTDVVDNVIVVNPGVVDPGNELQFGDGSAIDLAGILLDGEFIDISEPNPVMPQIVYNVRGDGGTHPDDANYQTTGFDHADARYVFSDLDVGNPGSSIGAVDIILDDVIGVALGSEVFFTNDSITLIIGTLGVLEDLGGPDLGTITLKMTVVPVPAALPLFAVGLVGLFGLIWHRRDSDRMQTAA